MSETIAQRLIATLRTAAHAYVPGNEVPPCAVLWPDPERSWESVIVEVQAQMPELYVLGAYAPAQRTGPAVWLRCIEARTVQGAPPAGTAPVFYLPGVSRERLRALEDCPAELAALAETQYRGTVWGHSNGKEWTPFGFLVSKLGGLGLDVAKDQATLGALTGALGSLIGQPVSHHVGRLLDAEFFNQLVAPDASGLLLRWLGNVEGFRQRCSEQEWKVFCQQCKADFRFDPEKDGALKAAQLLAGRGDRWSEVWQRFAESPANCPGVVEWLKRAAPKSPTMFDSPEIWPHLNERDERQLRESLQALVDRPQGQVIARLGELEKQHGARRRTPWQKLGLSPLATALEPLAALALHCANSPGAPTPEAFANYYASEGWRTDAAALSTMAACGTHEQHGVVLDVLRAVYLPWLEASARHLQYLIQNHGRSVAKRSTPVEAAPGRVMLFADGLRLDVAKRLAERLAARQMASAQEWEWSTIPSVTATAKPAASPLAGGVQGGEACDEFTSRLAASGQRMTQDRFLAALEKLGWQCLGAGETGDPSGSAWTECGTLDKRGHNEGWKLARAVESEVEDIASRIESLLKAGWSEVIVVTDHGWLLLPGGLPKVELKSFLAENRWGRCAALKADAQADVPTFHWHWNPAVAIASPPGVGCFRASMEYSHGGVSLQEMVTPRLVVSFSGGKRGNAQILTVKWSGAKCQVTIGGDCEGLRLDVRTRLSDPETSLLTERMAKEVSSQGKVSVFLEEDTDIGKKAEIVLMDAAGQVIASQSTTAGE